MSDAGSAAAASGLRHRFLSEWLADPGCSLLVKEATLSVYGRAGPAVNHRERDLQRVLLAAFQ
jgi:hypothetical protein